MRRFLRHIRPYDRVKIKLGSLASMSTVWVGEPAPCFHCRATGSTTRESHPFATPFHATPLVSYACGLCDGTGVYTPRSAPYLIARPSSRLNLIACWTDPATGVTHGKCWRNVKRGRARPSCGNGGMRAMPLEVWHLDGREITCEECYRITEQSLLSSAGCAPLTPRDISQELVSFSGCIPAEQGA